jgi:hypothetical protein
VDRAVPGAEQLAEEVDLSPDLVGERETRRGQDVLEPLERREQDDLCGADLLGVADPAAGGIDVGARPADGRMQLAEPRGIDSGS